MGITDVLETESGDELERIEDPHNLLHTLLPSEDNISFELLRYIDWYGDTVFNRPQMETFLDEWERVRDLAHTSEDIALHSRIKALAECNQSTPHLFLKFYGG